MCFVLTDDGKTTIAVVSCGTRISLRVYLTILGILTSLDFGSSSLTGNYLRFHVLH